MKLKLSEWVMIIAASLWWESVVPPDCYAGESRSSIARTASEQAAILVGIPGAVTHKPDWPVLSPPEEWNPYFAPIQRDYSPLWAGAGRHGHNSIVERIGNQACARFAKQVGLMPILGSRGRGIPQGPD